MSVRSLAEAKHDWLAAARASEEARENVALAEREMERAFHGWEQWDAQCAYQTALALLEQATDREREAKRYFLRLRERMGLPRLR